MIIADLTMPEFADGRDRCRTVLIPFGATEEHGPHLPLGTDSLLAETVARRLAEQRPLFVAPTLPYGVCRSTGGHPGTLSISCDTLRRLTLDLVSSLYRQGMRNVVLLSGHAGGTHNATLVDAGETLLARYADIRVAVVTELDLAREEAGELVETPGDSHAGEIETSRLLHSHPERVKGTAPREFPRFPRGILVRDKRSFWPGGVWGDPGRATAEKGRRMEELVVAGLARLVATLEAGVDGEGGDPP